MWSLWFSDQTIWCINDWHTDLETPMTIFIPKYGTTSVYVLVLLCGVVNHFSLFKFVLTSYIEFYTQRMNSTQRWRSYIHVHIQVWFKMSSARFVGHTDINRTEGVLFFYMTRNSDTLYRLRFQNTGFCGWEFEHAPIIEAMVRTSYNHRSHGFAILGLGTFG